MITRFDARGGGLERLALVRVEALDADPRQRLDEGRGRASGASPPASRRAPLRSSRRRCARRGGPGRSRSPRASPAGSWPSSGGSPGSRRRPCIACSELRSWMRRMSAPARTASAHGGDRPPLALARGQALLPGAGEHGADEVLARERDVERQAERRAARRAGAGSRGPARSSRSKSRPGSIAICSSATPRASARSTRPPNQAFRWSTTSSYSRRRPVDPRRALDVHQHVAAAALGDQLEHLLASRRRCR